MAIQNLTMYSNDSRQTARTYFVTTTLPPIIQEKLNRKNVEWIEKLSGEQHGIKKSAP